MHVEFDIRKLSKQEQSEYLDLDPADQKIFRELWIVREQELNRAKMETQRLRAKAQDTSDDCSWRDSRKRDSGIGRHGG